MIICDDKVCVQLKSFPFFCRVELRSSAQALKFISFLTGETEYMPWQTTLNNLDYYYLMLDRTEVYQPLQVNNTAFHTMHGLNFYKDTKTCSFFLFQQKLTCCRL